MATRNPLDLPKSGKLLALDIGTRRVGIAVCNSGRSVPSARGAAGRVQEIDWSKEKAEGVVAVVVGWPLNMDGTTGPSADRAASAADWIEKEQGLPVLLWDERLTSKQAEDAWFEQRQGRQTRGSKKASVGKMDAGAAVLILQGVLDALRQAP